MSAIKVENGVASIDASWKKFVGSTSMVGEFPPVGVDYDEFIFAPKPGTQGTLVFQDNMLSRMGGDDSYYLYQFVWEDDKLLIKYEHEKALYTVGKSRQLGYYIQRGNMIYFTGNTVTTGSEHVYKRVPLLELLKFLEGKTDMQALNKSSLRLRLAQIKQISLENQLRNAQTRICELKAKDEEAFYHRMEMANIGTAYLCDSVEGRAIIQMMPRWFWRLMLRWSKPHLLPRIEKIFNHEAPDLHLVRAKA